MAVWKPPSSNECPQPEICTEKRCCQDLCKARENMKAYIKEIILGYPKGKG